MEIDLNLIEESCGKQPENQEFFIVGNDPNFVFENDPNFETLRLFDIDGNIVNVNSWFECANYVNGGWTLNYSNFGGDVFFFGVTCGLLLLYFSIKIFVSKKT